MPAEAIGLDGDAKKAIAFAVLAHEAIHSRPGDLLACTGALDDWTVQGKITPGANYGWLR